MATEKKTTATVKPVAKAAVAKAEAAKEAVKAVEAPKAVEAKKEEVKKAPAKKAAAKTTETFVIQYQGRDFTAEEIVAKVVAAVDKKTIKDLNVYYQPETGKVYYTADDVKGDFDL